MPPRTWVDKDTGHRVWRLSDEPNSGGFYFNINAYTPDGKQMIYTAPDGIHVMDMATLKTKLLVANPPGATGRRHGNGPCVGGGTQDQQRLLHQDDAAGVNSVYKADTNTGVVRKLVDVPAAQHSSIAWSASMQMRHWPRAPTSKARHRQGVWLDRLRRPPAQRPARLAPDNRIASATQGPHYQPANKGAMMAARLAAQLPLVLFTLRLEKGPGEKPGTSNPASLHRLGQPSALLAHRPELLMYCHEGPWQKVDRIWMIHTDGTHNTLIHKRTMPMEIAGHEFWGLDGETIWYDWQHPKGEDFFLAGYNLKTGKRTAYHMQRNDWSIHFNLTKDLDLFCGDGGDPGQVAKAPDGEWIELFRPQLIRGTRWPNAPDFWQPGVFRSEHLVNMSHHNYREEPNVRFSPDKKLVIFTSNMFGPSYVFGAEVAKADNPPAADVQSTPELARKFNPVDPPSGSGSGTPQRTR